MLKQVDGVLVINPGSACRQALDLKPPSVALLHVNGNEARAEIVYLE
jgi:predicted phosphodiesterase